MRRYEKTGQSPIKSLSDNWFEMLLIAIVLGVVVLAHYLFNVGGAILNFFYLPVIVAAHYYGRNLACALAAFSVAVVAIFTIFDPTHMSYGWNEWLLLIFSVGVWAGFLGISAILVGTFSDHRRAALRHILERCRDGEHGAPSATGLRATDTLERVLALLHRAQEQIEREKHRGAADFVKEALEITQQEVDRGALELRDRDEALQRD